MGNGGDDSNDGGGADTSGVYDLGCGDVENKVDYCDDSEGGVGGYSNHDAGLNDGGVDTNSGKHPDCGNGNSKALCTEGTAGDNGSNDDGGLNDDSGVDTNDDGGEGDGDDNVGDNNNSDDVDEYDDGGDDPVGCSNGGSDNADSDGKDGKDDDDNGDNDGGDNDDSDNNDNENDHDNDFKRKFLQFNFARISTFFEENVSFLHPTRCR